ncbi:MAG: RsmB/NOP family class I SAM-dependent RNA methyltransferase [Rhodospirillales bacterium]|jgi:16S rRNA (cytosine967-C5)-methyltransferase|nr:RsmB/NOP family class I SAM-dependent RNA methyltransferase [Rhodospirillales bacterium]
MIPGARLQAAIELCQHIETATEPADAVRARYFRRRRYVGAKDRRAITERVFNLVRRRARLDWWIARAASDLAPSPRHRVVADLALGGGARPDEIARLFDGQQYCPATLDRHEFTLAQGLAGQPLNHPEMPDWVGLEYPEWLDPSLRQLWGPGLKAEMEAFNRPAALDLRVNTGLATVDEAREALAADGVEALPTPLSPIGLRLEARPNLGGMAAFRQGLIEVQDEGSQLIALLADARPGMTVVDYCAGAGGKTLALAAAMTRDGQLDGTLTACDVSAGRLRRMEDRLKRARVKGVEGRLLDEAGDTWIEERAASADRVLLDAPCSATGTWRRRPDARWRLTADDVGAECERQRRLLDTAQGLVRPGGRLVYATCSVLERENEQPVADFLGRHPDFAVLDCARLWRQILAAPCPVDGPFLRLSPAATQTDGFFVAILEHRA